GLVRRDGRVAVRGEAGPAARVRGVRAGVRAALAVRAAAGRGVGAGVVGRWAGLLGDGRPLQHALVVGGRPAVGPQALAALEALHVRGGGAPVLPVARGAEADPGEVGLELLDVAAGRSDL